MAKSILVVDDEHGIQSTLKAALTDEGYQVETASSGKEALEKLKDYSPEIILLDIWMHGMDGLDVLKTLKIDHPEPIVIMMSGHGTIETAVKATKLGAFDFIEKPLSLERLLVLLKNATGMLELSRENRVLRKQTKKHREIVGKSRAIEQIKEVVDRVAPTTGSVLITGENGTGKELVAHRIHLLSNRAQKPFIEVNCAAIPEELIESELFGHERGAFTGATQLKRGKFDLANGGSLFLDEIGDMSIKTQAKILRILQEQKFERVGGTETISVDVRIVAATNKDLKSAIAKGQFREDLFYRLNVIPCHIPALRERKEDVTTLVEHFNAEFSQTHAKPMRPFTPEALRVLADYPWPGNVRELKNLIERIIILTTEKEEKLPISAATLFDHLKDEVTGSFDLASKALSQNAGKSLKDARQLFEKEFILKTLNENGGNVSKTAQILGIERSHLHKKIKSFGIEA